MSEKLYPIFQPIANIYLSEEPNIKGKKRHNKRETDRQTGNVKEEGVKIEGIERRGKRKKIRCK